MAGSGGGLIVLRPAASTFDLPRFVLVVYLAWWTALAISPTYRADWLLENLMLFVAVPIVVWSRPRIPFSNPAYVALFVMFALHTLGAHYTYAETPYREWFEALSGGGIAEGSAWQRNHFDRFVHFAYGLLVIPAADELLQARAPSRGLWRVLLPFTFVTSHAAIYEVIEWIAALVFGGELGIAYLGTQGDEWDAVKDMAAAITGSVIALALWLPWSRRWKTARA